ncbi:hypothetical protein KXJ69_13440 [Aureisphaera sp. CAU 1614]|uniref:Uncharacterized protein n=1 Tax=Halomarinibacterium sedimenti TaxID=2857106 RepID=A0A9X1FR05_9FLAO|nr:hypothetical protein [Halomarinibacterium sedimenti]MBW2939114.1 hypothetical protein [Halomarinibacterium sedimenti]
MKKILLIILFASYNLLNAQIGIGTASPEADLHVGGSMLTQDDFKIENLSTVSATEEDFQLVTRLTTSNPIGKLAVLDVDALKVAPVNIINYTFNNVYLDNLDDVDLQYDETKYVVGVANFRQVGDAIKKVPGGDNYSIGHFVVRTFKSGGTWHLEISNKELDLDPTDSITYHVTLVVYDKKYFKDLPAITSSLGGSNTGVASSVPILE